MAVFGADDTGFACPFGSPLEAVDFLDATVAALVDATDGASFDAPEKMVDASDLILVSSPAKDLDWPERIEKGLITSPCFFSADNTGFRSGRLFRPDESVAMAPERSDSVEGAMAKKELSTEKVECMVSSSSRLSGAPLTTDAGADAAVNTFVVLTSLLSLFVALRTLVPDGRLLEPPEFFLRIGLDLEDDDMVESLEDVLRIFLPPLAVLAPLILFRLLLLLLL